MGLPTTCVFSSSFLSVMETGGVSRETQTGEAGENGLGPKNPWVSPLLKPCYSGHV